MCQRLSSLSRGSTIECYGEAAQSAILALPDAAAASACSSPAASQPCIFGFAFSTARGPLTGRRYLRRVSRDDSRGEGVRRQPRPHVVWQEAG